MEGDASLVSFDFPMYDFHDWRPGRRVHIARQRLEGLPAGHAAWTHSPGWFVVIALITPLALPLVGLALGLLTHLCPGDRVRLYLTVVELFRFGSPVPVWICILCVWCVVAIWMRLEAAFAPHEVVIDWQQNGITVTHRPGTVSATLSQLRSLKICPCLLPGTHASAAGPTTLIRLIGVLEDGRELRLLEAGEGDDVAGGPNRKSPLERIAPVAVELCETLSVTRDVVAPVVDRFDIVGFPRNDAWRHWLRVWKLAGAPSRTVAIILSCLTAVGISGWGHHAWNTVDTEEVRRPLSEEPELQEAADG